jgi:hypothetical protein
VRVFQFSRRPVVVKKPANAGVSTIAADILNFFVFASLCAPFSCPSFSISLLFSGQSGYIYARPATLKTGLARRLKPGLRRIVCVSQTSKPVFHYLWMNMSTISEKDLRRIGNALFGKIWVGPMARDLKVSPQYIRMMASGKRPITRETTARLEALCRKRFTAIDRWHERLAQCIYPETARNV